MKLFRQRKLVSAGTKAPDFRLKKLSGGEVAMSELAAKGPFLLVFYKVTCPVCQLTLPYLERLHAAGALPVIGVSQHDAEDTREFCDYYKLTFPMLLDSADEDYPASNAYGISTVPTWFLVDRDGTIIQVQESWSRKDVEGLGTKFGVTVIQQGDNVPAWKAG